MSKIIIRLVLRLVSLVAIARGVWLIYPPCAYLVVGVMLWMYASAMGDKNASR